MTHPLHLDLPEHVYARLLHSAQHQGRAPEEVAVALIEAELHRRDAESVAAEVQITDPGEAALNRANDVGA